MQKYSDLVSLLERSLSAKPQEKLEKVGIVISSGDSICRIYGLKNAIYSELVEFEGGNKGIILDLDEDYVSAVLLDYTIPVIEQETVKLTGNVFQIPVSEKFLGRVINAVGAPIDALGTIDATETRPVERSAPGITDREPVTQPFETGILAIDSLIPIGKGQRELIIGDRNTGKTTIALNTILNQKDKNVICIYVAIGHKQSSTASIVHLLEKNEALEYSIVIDANAKETALNRFLAPYTGCSIAEYFMDQGRDVLIVYDDLSNHAITYRELSLLLRRPPGREAYPGDIFYTHSRLLERAGKLSKELGGGSMTALPIICTKGDDISAYIPTNLISITDGQIFLDSNLFNAGIRPAIHIGFSVSRVGSAAQIKCVKDMAGSLKLKLAQYNDLMTFAQFGSELDKLSQQVLDSGNKATELLKQSQLRLYSFVEQTLLLFLIKENYLEKIEINYTQEFAKCFLSYIATTRNDIYRNIYYNKKIDSFIIVELRKVVNKVRSMYVEYF